MSVRLSLLLPVLLLAVSAHAHVSFGPVPVVEGTPGEYVTFALPVNGDGDINVSLETPPGFEPVNSSRTLSVSGSALVPFTLRIPASALSGTRAALTATATDGGGSSTSTDITVTVLGSTGTGLAESDNLQATPGEVLSFTVTVTNEANQPDTIVLSAHNASRDVLVSPERLELGPFQSGTVTVTVPVQGRTNDGYTFLIELRAHSRVADATTVRQIRATYASGNATVRAAERDPQLTLRLTAAASAGLEATEGETNPFFSWSVTPGLSGELSDYVDLSIRSGSFGNTESSPFALPSSSIITLSGEDWDASLDLGAGRVGLGGSLQAADWRFSVTGNFMRFADSSFFGLYATANSLSPELDLQFSGNMFVLEGIHSESVGALYRRQLKDGRTLGAGVGLTGSSSPDSDGYRLSVNLSQSLTWTTQNFDLTQSVSTSPGLGLSNITVLGGNRSAHPLGVRFMSRLAITPGSTRLTNSVQLSSQPVPALRLSTGITHETTDFGAGPGLLRLQFGVSWRFSRSTIRFDGATFHALDETTQSGNRFRVGFSSSLGRLTLGLGLTTERWDASTIETASSSLLFDTRATFRYGSRSELEARLDLERSAESGYRFALRWQHSWSQHFDSDVSVGFTHLGQDFAIGLAARDVFTDGLRFGLGYGLNLTGGITTHRLAAGVSYTWRIPFNTPQPLVDLFGGRETGSISGVAFSDTNLNLRRDSGEEPLAGVLVRAGEFSAVTGEDGRFTLRLPEGRHELEFAGSLPATFGYTGVREVEIRLGQNETMELPFAPVSMMRVGVFLDADRDGMRSGSEPLLPGTALQLEGPAPRRIVTGADGYSWLTGLVEGMYELSADFASLPAGYVLTGELAPVRVSPPANAGEVLIPVAPRIRDVVTTFTASNLAVTAYVSQANVTADSDVEVSAIVNGGVSSVSVELFGERFSLEQDAALWRARLNVPAQAGLARGFVEASNGTATARADIQLFVTVPD